MLKSYDVRCLCLGGEEGIRALSHTTKFQHQHFLVFLLVVLHHLLNSEIAGCDYVLVVWGRRRSMAVPQFSE